jgi:hypothetical protein
MRRAVTTPDANGPRIEQVGVDMARNALAIVYWHGERLDPCRSC